MDRRRRGSGGHVLRGGVALIAALVLSGCNTFYTADIRNMSGISVTCEIRQTTDMPEGSVLVRRRVGAGERAKVGPVRAPQNSVVYLYAEPARVAGHPARMRLGTGTTIVHVGRIDEGTLTRVTLEEVRE